MDSRSFTSSVSASFFVNNLLLHDKTGVTKYSLQGEIAAKEAIFAHTSAYGEAKNLPRHGHVGKPSNNAKSVLLRELFRSFVRANRSSNGKKERKVTFFLSPQYARIANTKKEQKEAIGAPRAFSYHFKAFFTMLQEEGTDTAVSPTFFSRGCFDKG
jgi:hypothetical protein